MSVLSRPAFADLLSGLDREALARFVADLYAARGWDVELESHGEGTDRRRLIVSRERPPERRVIALRPVDGAVPGDADAAIVPERSPSGDAIGADDLYGMALYAVDPGTREALFREHFGRPPDAEADPGSAGIARPAAAGVALAALVVLGALAATGMPGAGGGAVLGGGRATPTPTPAEATVPTAGGGAAAAGLTSPAPRPTRRSDSVGAGFPPGLANGGVVDAGALARAHVAAMDNRSYRWTLALRGMAASVGGVTWNRVRKRARVHNSTVYRLRVRGVTAGGNGSRALASEYAIYADGTRRYTRNEGPNRVYYLAGPVDPPPFGDRFTLRTARYVAAFLSASETSLVRVHTRGDPLRFRVIASGTTDWPTLGESAEYTAFAVVGTDGTVHELHVSFGSRMPGETPVGLSVEYRAIGETTVEAPPWYETALERTDE